MSPRQDSDHKPAHPKSSPKRLRILTHLSPAYWCNPKAEPRWSFEQARLRIPRQAGAPREPKHIAWVDALFEGGIILPLDTSKHGESEGRALTLLLTGPPGTGKSLFALELCHRCEIVVEDDASQDEPGGVASVTPFKEPKQCLYVTLEGHKPWIESNVRSLGWEGFLENQPASKQADPPKLDIVSLDREGLSAYLSDETPVDIPTAPFWYRYSPNIRRATAIFQRLKDGVEGAADAVNRELGMYQSAHTTAAQDQPHPASASSRESFARQGQGVVPHVLVFDGLNTVYAPATASEDSLDSSTTDKGSLYSQAVTYASRNSGALLVILILDSSPRSPIAEAWEFAADIVIRFDREYPSKYMIRTIEIIKARYQKHIWGKHQLKLLTGRGIRNTITQKKRGTTWLINKKKTSMEELQSIVARRSRRHPYRVEGGINVFPSIHYFISQYKRASSPPSQPPLAWCLKEFTESMGMIPRGRCVSLIGPHGAYKSHLGYVQLLAMLLNRGPGEQKPYESKEVALIVSLRADETGVRNTLQKIAVDQFGEKPSIIWDLEAQGRLEISYYMPGYISPEEFFSRLVLSTSRLRTCGDHMTILFNSLDQLSARFPLCAKEDIFVSSIIELTDAEGATSFFVGAEEEDAREPEYFGLLSMSEVIIAFELSELKPQEIWDLMCAANPDAQGLPRNAPPIRAIDVSVRRAQGAMPGGGKGSLVLLDGISVGTTSFSRGLHFLRRE